VLILDGLSGFRSEWDDAAAPMTADLQRVFGAGPEVGIHSVVTADRASVVPGAIQSLTRQRWLFRLGDPSEFALIGVRAADVPDFHPGGALTGEDAQEVQVGRPADGLAGAVARIIRASTRASDRARRPQGIGQLPDVVRRSTIAAGARADRAPWTIPVGISERTLMPAGFALHDGGHALVAGPPRSGRSTTLVTLAEVVRTTSSAVRIVAVAGARSPLATCAASHRVLEPEGLRAELDDLAAQPGGLLVLVDDADLIGDEDGAMATLLGRRRPDIHVVAAGRNDSLRTLYGHWTRTVRQSRVALLLQPDLDLDGDLVGLHLPRRPSVPLSVGRGYLVGAGESDIVQIAGKECLYTKDIEN